MRRILTRAWPAPCKNPARVFEVMAEQKQRNVAQVTKA